MTESTSRPPSSRRRMAATLSGSIALVLAALSLSPAFAQEANWIGTWTASPQPIWGEDFVLPVKIPATLQNRTIRQIVRVGIGGSRVRIVISNEYGGRPLTIGGASVALAGEGSAVVAATARKLTFGGQDQVVVPPGAPVVSDPVDLRVTDAARLTASLFLPDLTPLT